MRWPLPHWMNLVCQCLMFTCLCGERNGYKHLAFDVIDDPIRPAITGLARGTDPNQIVKEIILMPMPPRIGAVHCWRELRV